MQRKLLHSPAFIRAAKRLVKKNSQLAGDVKSALELLAEDAFHPALKTHKLKGDLAECWACSAGYDLRIVFKFVVHENAEAIQLLSAGTHDEVY
ncbi:MAG TPA: type II toxin-antitoxin system mRNA interferase toxin, RelE/StbE family [Blastocatellia bacterium]|nr:type II toxin-antitoxin system mRNA interferase toxin, RelE/StbE family [Blastocatellia bacterium]HMV86535.1 type II toxin-antitoxin system mRNA interferase toxin, RelE/StbE family [Blastocatellia bacterium]HMX28553.1 type II toxin-antitoxin system mRNA interferase toxin, RelE/StbE family [Blastocatellia bacterium]HMY70608.1 type II toxin-antitoxin system mRNA interferase toxin, RelE/StbE family [Blastocatellia bacterium]HNG31395.1 type II toxin-antitoxin system mRNA interferase toxin, RelE/